MHDYTPITELPGTLLNREQMARISQRYELAAWHAQDRRVLEVACGAGMGLGLLATSAKSVVGLDYTQQVLAVARQQYGNRMALLGGDAQQLPFANSSFDLLVNFEAIYYLPEPRHFLREAWRVLAEEGTLLICTSNPDWSHFVPGALTIHYPTAAELQRWLYECGFHEIALYGAFQTAATGQRQGLVASLRKRILQSGLIAPESHLGRAVKRLAYGRLIPLPAELQLETLPQQRPEATMVQLAVSQTDTSHRVLYALARRG
jgi:ubiquinone/menaquinone biosynthesis C-methylase UbiE